MLSQLPVSKECPSGLKGLLIEPIWTSTVDFVDVHPYPGYVPFDQLAQDFRLAGTDRGKPVIMGEFGAFTFSSAARYP